jgi:hypothetical protein
MRKVVLPLLVVLAGLSACDRTETGNKTDKAPPPLYENPPFGASDIDATVAETRKRMTPPPAAGQAQPGNVQDPAPPAQGGATPQ